MMEFLLGACLLVSIINLVFCIMIANFLVKHGDQTKEIQVDTDALKDGLATLMKQVAMRPITGLIDPNAER